MAKKLCIVLLFLVEMLLLPLENNLCIVPPTCYLFSSCYKKVPGSFKLKLTWGPCSSLVWLRFLSPQLRPQLPSLAKTVALLRGFPIMASLKEVFNHKNVGHVAVIDVPIHNTRSPACSSVKSVVPSACVYLQELMAISRFVLATTTGRPKEEDPSALKLINTHLFVPLPIMSTLLNQMSCYSMYNHYNMHACNHMRLNVPLCVFMFIS